MDSEREQMQAWRDADYAKEDRKRFKKELKKVKRVPCGVLSLKELRHLHKDFTNTFGFDRNSDFISYLKIKMGDV